MNNSDEVELFSPRTPEPGVTPPSPSLIQRNAVGAIVSDGTDMGVAIVIRQPCCGMITNLIVKRTPPLPFRPWNGEDLAHTLAAAGSHVCKICDSHECGVTAAPPSVVMEIQPDGTSTTMDKAAFEASQAKKAH